MLVRNPLTTYLYDYGYNGIDNIYSFWLNHRKDILKSYVSKMKSLRRDNQDVIAFRYKVRWGSHQGMFLRLAIDKLLRKTKENDPLRLREMTAKIGYSYMSLADFSRHCFDDDPVDPLIDLRGLSIISRSFKDTIISDVNFDYAALDSCTFNSVTFINCQFNHTSFRHCILNNCVFDEDCILDNNDFSNMRFTGEVKCQVHNPKFTYMTRFTRWQRKHFEESRYLSYSKISSDSFIHQCSDQKIRERLAKSHNKAPY